jgi:hypothetical protein
LFPTKYEIYFQENDYTLVTVVDEVAEFGEIVFAGLAWSVESPINMSSNSLLTNQCNASSKDKSWERKMREPALVSAVA